MINYNRPQNIRFKGIIGMNNVISSVNYFSGGGYLYVRIILQNSIHCLSQYLNVPLNKFSENDVILKNLVLTAKSFLSHFYLGNSLEHIVGIFGYCFIHK